MGYRCITYYGDTGDKVEKNIFTESEFRLEATVAKFTTVQMEGKR